MFDARSMLKAAGINVAEMEERFNQLRETVQAGYVAFVDVQALVHVLVESNARMEVALTILLADRNKAEHAKQIKADLDEVFANGGVVRAAELEE